MSDVSPLAKSLATLARMPVTAPVEAPRSPLLSQTVTQPAEPAMPVYEAPTEPEPAFSAPTVEEPPLMSVNPTDDPSSMLAGFDPSRYLAGGSGSTSPTAHGQSPDPEPVVPAAPAVPVPVPMPSSADPDSGSVSEDGPQPVRGPRPQQEVMAMLRELSSLRDR